MAPQIELQVPFWRCCDVTSVQGSARELGRAGVQPIKEFGQTEALRLPEAVPRVGPESGSGAQHVGAVLFGGFGVPVVCGK